MIRLFILLLVCIAQFGVGQETQNLVLNPSFELFEKCPIWKYHHHIKYLLYWNSPNIKTPDFYNTCGYTIDCVIPFEGDGYAGGFPVSEYHEGQLKCKLKEGHRYYFEFYVKPTVPCLGSIVSDIAGVAFMKTQLSENRLRNKELPEDVKPDITSPPGLILKDSTKWIKVSGTFEAEGEEQFLLIGFFPNENRVFEYLQFHPKKGRRWRPYKGRMRNTSFYGPWYYTYDAVKLIALDSLGNPDTTFCTDFVIPEAEEVDYTQMDRGGFEILPKVQFKNGSADLIKGAEQELKYLWGLYVTYPETQIEIGIHTDSLENPMAEEERCRRRSKTLTLMLRSWGVPEENLRFLFKRSTEPIPEGYKHSLGVGNERIEYRLVE